jgi:hypothetical protein
VPRLARRIDPRLDQPRNSSKTAFWSAMGSARMRLSQRWIGGRLSVRQPPLKLEAGALAEIGKADAGELALMQQVIPARQASRA